MKNVFKLCITYSYYFIIDRFDYLRTHFLIRTITKCLSGLKFIENLSFLA